MNNFMNISKEYTLFGKTSKFSNFRVSEIRAALFNLLKTSLFSTKLLLLTAFEIIQTLQFNNFNSVFCKQHFNIKKY